MDKRKLVKNLNSLFCQLDKEGRKYSEVWLEEANFGGLYMSGKYTLNIRAQHKIDDCGEEINDIVFILYEKAPEEYKYIFNVVVYGAGDNIHCENSDVKIYDETESCK